MNSYEKKCVRIAEKCKSKMKRLGLVDENDYAEIGLKELKATNRILNVLLFVTWARNLFPM